MTRFVYLSDTHIGTTPIEFQQQPAFPGQMDRLLDALNAWITREGDIDFIIHGGDMVNDVSRHNIRRAAELFDRVSVPTYLCLGNHDLTHPDALGWWLEHAPHFFIDGEPDFVLDREEGRICVMPNQWEATPWYWSDEQRPHFTPDQREWLSRMMSDENAPQTRLFITHSPVHAVPTGQTGFAAPFHTPPEAFAAEIDDITQSMPGLECVVGAHSHINTCTEHDGLTFVTVSAFVEAPFEFKVFEMDHATVRMSTHNLANDIDFPWRYDFDKTYVQGRHCDRQFRSVPDADPAVQHP